MKLIPYLYFKGNCEEALNHYKKALNGKISVSSRYNDPNMKAPEDYKDKILHAMFSFGDNTLMASDIHWAQELQVGDSTSLSILFDGEEEEARRIFNELSEGGTIQMPFEKQFWGDLFGQFIDRFQVKWMINSVKM